VESQKNLRVDILERWLDIQHGWALNFTNAQTWWLSAFGAEKPIRFYFAFKSLHKPIVIARWLCCKHSSSLNMKSGAHIIKTKTSMNIIPIVIF
jgi:hypothetical protein